VAAGDRIGPEQEALLADSVGLTLLVVLDTPARSGWRLNTRTPAISSPTRAGELIGTKLAVLQRHCVAVGRPYEAIERTSLGTVNLGADGMTASQVLETCRDLADAGIQQAAFNMPNVHEITPLDVIGREIIPAVAGV
jgi:hypothetical protein